MALVPARTEIPFVEFGMDGSVESLGGLLDSQKKLFHSQVDQLQRLVVAQCKLTGVNPLSQEMAAGALSIKIGKKPRDLLNPKAIKYMQSVFAIKDTFGKRETREISALCGVTVTQVRDFFSGQRSRVRMLVNLAKEKAARSDAFEAANGRCPTNPDATPFCGDDAPSSAVDARSAGESAILPASSGNLSFVQYGKNVPVCLTDAKPVEVIVLSSSSLGETIPGIDEDDKKFLENILNLMRKEGTFSGQVKLMEWILQIHNSAVLIWFLTKGGITILATWLSQAAIEEQKTVLDVILKVLCHLPLHKALPEQMSAILQTVNKLRFYRTPDISNRARVLLSRWSKMLVRNQALKNPSILNSSNGVQKDIIRKQRISDILRDEFWQSKIGISGETVTLTESSGNDRKSMAKQAVKMLTASVDCSNRKQGQSVSSIKIKERRKVLLVEQLDQKFAGRVAPAGRAAPSNHSRPISADDIQKAKMRAMFMQHKYGKADPSPTENNKIEDNKDLLALQSAPRMTQQAEAKSEEEEKPAEVLLNSSETQTDVKSAETLHEVLFESLKTSQFQWQTPAEMKIDGSWRVSEGESSKELEVQAQRILREKETFYPSTSDIPPNPKEPWDVEMDFDDSLTPEIPIEQPPDTDAAEGSSDPPVDDQPNPETTPAALPSPPAPTVTASGNAAAPDLELLSVLLKHPNLVFALTTGQGKDLTSDQRVALLDMIKQSSVALNGNVNGFQENPKELEPTSLPSPTPPSDAARVTGWRSAFPTTAKIPLPESQLSGTSVHSFPTQTTPKPPLPALLSALAELQANVLPMSQVFNMANSASVASPELQSTIQPWSQVIMTANGVPINNFNTRTINPALPQHILPLSHAIQASPNPQSATPSFQQVSYSHIPPPTLTIHSQSSLPPTHRIPQLPPVISEPSSAAFLPNSSTWLPQDEISESLTRQHPQFVARDNVYKDSYAMYQGQSTGREEIVDRSRHSESWSPESSPVRSPEFTQGQGRSYSGLRREHGRNQRQNWSRQRNWGSRDQYRLSNGGGGRWRDRDRDRRR